MKTSNFLQVCFMALIRFIITGLYILAREKFSLVCLSKIYSLLCKDLSESLLISSWFSSLGQSQRKIISVFVRCFGIISSNPLGQRFCFQIHLFLLFHGCRIFSWGVATLFKTTFPRLLCSELHHGLSSGQWNVNGEYTCTFFTVSLKAEYLPFLFLFWLKCGRGSVDEGNIENGRTMRKRHKCINYILAAVWTALEFEVHNFA